MSKHTPGPWQEFICDDGGQWSGWPLSISAVNDEDKCIVRPGGHYPYAWDSGMSQREAVANARLIAAAPDLLEALGRIAALTPRAANARSADDLHATVKAIADTALSKATA